MRVFFVFFFFFVLALGLAFLPFALLGSAALVFVLVFVLGFAFSAWRACDE
jgi:hypothetical protein